MTRFKTILAGICTGLVALGVLGAWVWHFMLADGGEQMEGGRKWYVSGIEYLRGVAPQGDVWQFPQSLLLEPASVQRAEWSETAFAGRDPWGYILYYKARVKDARLCEQLRTVADSGLRDLPGWAAHSPQWWRPQRSIPRGGVPELNLRSEHLGMEVVDGEVFLYWIVSYEGYL